MRDVNQHFELIEKALEYSVAIEAELEIKRRIVLRGTITGVAYFADGSRLEFTERVVINNGRLIKQRYRYPFVQKGEPVFRYDNAPHHQHVSTHPHHKHVGNNIIPAMEPEFRQVLEEAAALLPKTTNQPAKKRRPSNPRKGKL